MGSFLPVLTATLVSLFLRSLFAILAGGVSESESGIFLERGLYFVVYDVTGAILFFSLLPALFSNRPLLPESKSHGAEYFLLSTKRFLPAVRTGIAGGFLLYVSLLFLLHLLGLSRELESGHGWMSRRLQKDSFFFSLVILNSVVFTPFSEELFYRWILPRSLVLQRVSPVVTLILQAVLFGLAHSPGTAPFLIFAGLIFGGLAYRYGFLSSFLAHMVYNLLILLHTRFIP